MTPRIILFAAIVSAFCGCVPFSITTPSDFARLDSPPRPYQYRAMSAYGVALAVRSEANPSHGSLDFWAEAVDRTLRGTRAYHPAGMSNVRSRNGTPGRRLEYRYGDAQSGSVYVVVVYASTDRVWVLEVGGTQEAFARARAGVTSAIDSFTTQ